LKTYDGYRFPVQRVDAVRYFLLLHYGGIYLDLDNVRLHLSILAVTSLTYSTGLLGGPRALALLPRLDRRARSRRPEQ
jgi:hypothetical protein